MNEEDMITFAEREWGGRFTYDPPAIVGLDTTTQFPQGQIVVSYTTGGLRRVEEQPTIKTHSLPNALFFLLSNNAEVRS